MNKTKLALIIVFFVFILPVFFTSFFNSNILYFNNALKHLAGPFFTEKITAEQILANYKNDKIKILIVPGHDNDSFGTQFGEIKESKINAELGQELFEFFQKDNKFETHITRVKNGDYSQWFSDYFESNKEEIKNFTEVSKKQWRYAIEQGMPLNNQVEHNFAIANDALKLYAVNKWANENNAEVVLHIHFNDYPGRRLDQQGEYSGFSIYTPEYQLPNHRSSLILAKSLKERLEKYFAKSNTPAESSILIEDQELIAVGSNGSRDGISVLVEYGYIYEPQFANNETRAPALKEAAYQTYVGIKNFFEENGFQEIGYETTLLPHKWSNALKKGMSGNVDIMSLQMALSQEGLYPPNSKNLEECPINGVFRNCTYEAVKKFQEKYADEILAGNGKIEKASGFPGPKTLAKLNELYGK